MPAKRHQPRAYIGASGFHYDHWAGPFYPEDLPKKRWLRWYAQRFDAVEINNTFYSLPARDTLKDWKDQTPPGFRFAIKMSRYATHLKRLKDPREPIDRFLERVEVLGSRLGPILVQLPPNWHADPDRLEGFLAAAPRRHRWAIELRDPHWLCDEVFDVLRRREAALVIHDLIDRHPKVVTADWIYRRYHGPSDSPKYAGAYSHQKLTAEARRLRDDLAAGRDAYAFFNNDQAGHAPGNAADLRRYLDGGQQAG